MTNIHFQTVVFSIFTFILGVIIDSNLPAEENSKKISISESHHIFLLICTILFILSLKYINVVLALLYFTFSITRFFKYRNND